MKQEHKGTIRVYKGKSVYDETLVRMRLLFDDFPNVVVGFSGGKDSTVCLNMALKVAEEKINYYKAQERNRSRTMNCRQMKTNMPNSPAVMNCTEY